MRATIMSPRCKDWERPFSEEVELTKRRAHSEGTIYQRKDGRWCTQITLANGRRKTKHAGTQREAKEWPMKTRKEDSDGLLLDAGKATIAQFLDRWYNDVAVHTLRLATQQGYRYILEQHVKPAIGKVALSSLRPDHLAAPVLRCTHSHVVPDMQRESAQKMNAILTG
jgi:hypothetical protein